jgi:hypothetical protein
MGHARRPSDQARSYPRLRRGADIGRIGTALSRNSRP